MEIKYESRNNNLYYDIATSLSPVIHMHKELEIVQVVEGHAVAYADSKSYVLNPGDTFVAFPNQIHYYKCNDIGKFIVYIFSSDCVYNLSKKIAGTIPDSNLILFQDVPYLSELAQQLISLTYPCDSMILNGYIHLMFGYMLPQLSLTAAHPEHTDSLSGIMKYCSGNFKEAITLDTVAKDLHLSKYYVSHLINEKLGQNFNEYLNKLRIGEACLLLKETDKKIADISEDVGFGSLRSFNRAFKHVMGVTPVTYREQNLTLQSAVNYLI